MKYIISSVSLILSFHALAQEKITIDIPPTIVCYELVYGHQNAPAFYTNIPKTIYISVPFYQNHCELKIMAENEKNEIIPTSSIFRKEKGIKVSFDPVIDSEINMTIKSICPDYVSMQGASGIIPLAGEKLMGTLDFEVKSFQGREISHFGMEVIRRMNDWRTMVSSKALIIDDKLTQVAKDFDMSMFIEAEVNLEAYKYYTISGGGGEGNKTTPEEFIGLYLSESTMQPEWTSEKYTKIGYSDINYGDGEYSITILLK
ncbi:hypothetical protein SAMN04488029_0865 [Reichenbachiella faecimaris]|uniref:Uncharacterized protein n=1 Tax=Reichenbachiella faecimaris TaxID=692418 RepID=A0A1W2G764_REIFA|nr:hypothetical protein [Reichenbachiella faecimaris]SMD32520.1 hypothetical protein SAMN04488029_0865 [Reichenbachiella faecimaris]